MTAFCVMIVAVVLGMLLGGVGGATASLILCCTALQVTPK